MASAQYWQADSVVLDEFPLGAIAVLVAVAILSVIYVVVILHAASKGKWLASLRRHLERCRTSAWRSPESDMDRAVRERMLETGLANFNVVNGLLLHIFPIFSCGIAMEILSRGELVDWPVVGVEVLAVVLTFLLHLFPQLLDPKRLRYWQQLYFLIACALVMPGVCSAARLSSTTRLSGLMMTTFNCALLHVPTAIAQHSVYLIVVRQSIAASPAHAEDWSHQVGMEVVTAIVSCLCVAVMQRLVEAQHRSNLQAKCLEEKQLANNKLLSMFYEVVVEVDSGLTIVSSDPDLGLFLPHRAGSPIPTLVGTKLDELLPDAQDRQLLVQHTDDCPPVGEGSSVDVMHLRMCYGRNDCLNVELFSLRFCGLMGQQRHLLGVREFGDEDQKRDRSCMTLRFDAFHPDFNIVDISPSLQSELGGAPGSSLCSLAENPEEVGRKLQDAVNTVASDDSIEPSYTFRAVLQPRGQTVRIMADCCVSMDVAHERPPGVRCAMRLSLSNLATLHRGSLPSSSSGDSRGSRASRGSRYSSRIRGTPRRLRSETLARGPQATRLGVPLSL